METWPCPVLSEAIFLTSLLGECRTMPYSTCVALWYRPASNYRGLHYNVLVVHAWRSGYVQFKSRLSDHKII